ncbi:Glycosyltransferase [Granulibacter bethesdensis]|uniref:glycosyltransferase family 4 protein n=1 Tax=Granulibacter bethesdensis TaxID=364410 RepID=UPI0009099D2C|nr:glycosyltransferase family 4 protein [Granulibacter bethesdensis]APH57222.1 Glycosyltransferase [Granulibacter bethesdensis]
MHIFFIQPAATDPTAGGHRYNRELIEALQQKGHSVTDITLKARFVHNAKVAEEEAGQVFSTLMASSGQNSRIVIDGMSLPAFHHLPSSALRCLTPLVHRPGAAGQRGDCPGPDANVQQAEQTVLSAVSHAVVTLEQTRDRLIREYGVADAQISVVESGFAAYAPASGTRNRDSSSPCEILSVGTLVKRKGYDVLLKALARLTDLSWHLTITGNTQRDPAYVEVIREQAEQAGLSSRVTLLSCPGHGALQTLWEAADLYAQASWWDGPLSAALQSLRRGIPLAITASQEAAMKLPLNAGALCAPGDYETLSKVLRRLIFDDSLRKSYATAAWNFGAGLPGWDMQAQAFIHALPPTGF